MKLPYILMPSFLVDLCSRDFESNRAAYTMISETVFNDQFLSLSVKRIFGEDLNMPRLEKLLATLGQERFRNIITAYYVQKVIIGQYIREVDLGYIDDILAIEERFKQQSLYGNSKAFLLGIYLYLSNLGLEEEQSMDEVIVPVEVDEILALRPVKHLDIDWLILSVWHLVHYLGADKAKRLLTGHQGDLSKIWPGLNQKQQQGTIRNLTNYAASIDRDDFLLYSKV